MNPQESPVPLWRDPTASPEARVADLLALMTLDEKVAQLGAFWDRAKETDVEGVAGGAPVGQVAPGSLAPEDWDAPEGLGATGGRGTATSQVVPEGQGVSGGRETVGGRGATEGRATATVQVVPQGQVAPMPEAGDSPFDSLRTAGADGIGHLTRVFGTRPVSVATGVAELRAAQRFLTDETRLGVPAIAHEECLAGITALGATAYPVPPAWGATFDPELIERLGAAIGADLAALGVHQGLAPLLDVTRDYRWGRIEETIGEDPYLVGMLGTAYVRGLESRGVVATLKHFAGYPASRAGRNHAPVSMGPREFADVMLPPFELAVRLGGAGSVMNSYCDVDGEPVAASHRLLTEVLRDEWGFTGTVVSDYWAMPFLHSKHRVAPDLASAAALAVTAGMDVELPDRTATAHLSEAVASGALPLEALDTAVARVLRQKLSLGLLDVDWRPSDADPDSIDLDSPGNRRLARQLAAESVVLLSNDGLLPVAPNPDGVLANDAQGVRSQSEGVGADSSSASEATSGVRAGRGATGGTGDQPAKIAVIGPVAGEPRSLFGCYSFPNHVLSRYGGDELGVAAPSVLDAIIQAFPNSRVDHLPAVDFAEPDASGIPAAVAAAALADLVFLTVGDIAGLFSRGTSGEGCDADTLSLPGSQPALVDAVLDAGTPTVLLLVTGRPYALGDFTPRANAIVQAFMPGEEGAAAILDVVTGKTNPSGRLPLSVPARVGGQPGTYLGAPLAQHTSGISNLDPTPAFPFGHGLSYTEFRYSGLSLSAESIPNDGELRVSCVLTNTGPRAGATVAQLYVHDEWAEVVRPVKELLGFARVELEPGQSKRVTWTLHADRTSFTGRAGHRIVEPGEFTLWVGRSFADLPLSAAFRVLGPTRQVPPGRVLTTPFELADV